MREKVSAQNRQIKVAGIVAEYNPFHNGHRFHLEDTRAKTGADYIIIVMSGNFMQRGTPALVDKYSRAKMALLNGADLVLELPSGYSASSAEYFATGAISLLDKLGVVNYLGFGSECGDISVLDKIAEILLDEPDAYVEKLRENLRRGQSYPSARTDALLQYCPALNEHREVMSSANNILGIEYIKALKRCHSSIQPYTTLRDASNYHDRMLNAHQSSALAIRQAIYDRQPLSILQDQIPEPAFDILSAELAENNPLQLNDLSAFLYYKLLMEADNGYSHYLDVSADLSERIRKNLCHFVDFRSYCDLLKTKELTYTRISRCLLHILLGMEEKSMSDYLSSGTIFYARVLGFRRESEPLLTAIKANSKIPLLTKLADASEILNEKGLSMLKQEIRINSIYTGASALKSGQPIVNEYQTPIAIV